MASVIGRDSRKNYVTSYPSYGLWFDRLMGDVRYRMGEEVY